MCNHNKKPVCMSQTVELRIQSGFLGSQPETLHLCKLQISHNILKIFSNTVKIKHIFPDFYLDHDNDRLLSISPNYGEFQWNLSFKLELKIHEIGFE